MIPRASRTGLEAIAFLFYRIAPCFWRASQVHFLVVLSGFGTPETNGPLQTLLKCVLHTDGLWSLLWPLKCVLHTDGLWSLLWPLKCVLHTDGLWFMIPRASRTGLEAIITSVIAQVCSAH